MGSSPLGNLTPSFRKPPRKRVRLLYERRISLFAFFVALPGMVLSAVFIWLQPWLLESRLALIFVELFVWWLLAMALQEQTTRPLQTLANVIAALREEDYSFRARGAATDDALGELSLEVNALADLLAEQRIRAIEATALLRRVVEEIEVPLFTFDPDQILRLVNSAGERLLQQPSVRLLGRTAKEIGLEKCLAVENETLVPLTFQAPNARWLVRRSSFRQRGVPHTLIVLSDVSRALREEERGAWQRLIRVLGHELNNSLTPIKSIAGSLHAQLSQPVLTPDAREDFQRGLAIIGTQSRFPESFPAGVSSTRADATARRLARLHCHRSSNEWLDSKPDCEYGSFLVRRRIDARSRPVRANADQPSRNAVEAALEPRHTDNANGFREGA